MIKDVLQSIAGIEIYPIISLLLFFLTFIFTVIKVWNLDKNYREKMKELPLDTEYADKK